MLDAAATKLGITADELKTQLRSGQTLAQLATAHNTTEQAVKDAARGGQDQARRGGHGGHLTQAQADAAYAELEQRGINFAGKGPGRGGDHGGAALRRAAGIAGTASGTST